MGYRGETDFAESAQPAPTCDRPRLPSPLTRKADMNDFFKTQDCSNKAVLAKTGDGMSALTTQLAIDLHRQNRKVNSGGPVRAKPAAPWYRRFDKR